MIVVGRIMAVTVNGPEHVFVKSVRMPMIRDHCQMLFDRVDDLWRMARQRRDGPDQQRQRQKS